MFLRNVIQKVDIFRLWTRVQFSSPLQNLLSPPNYTNHCKRKNAQTWKLNGFVFCSLARFFLISIRKGQTHVVWLVLLFGDMTYLKWWTIWHVIGFELCIVHVNQIGTFYFDFIIGKIYLQIHSKAPNYLFM